MDDKTQTRKDSLPEEFSTLKEAGEFWDTHSTAEREEIFEPVDVEFDLPPRTGKRIVLAAALAEKLSEVARREGISTETLANLWLQEKLAQILH